MTSQQTTPKRQFKHQQTTTSQPEQKIEIIHAPNDPTVATFIIHNETHTLGNSLRYILMKNKNVSFCGYTIPHPLEPKMTVRVQTNGIKAEDAVRLGLNDLKKVNEHVMDVFNKAIEEYEENK